jgi:hypothetical protein
MDTEEKSASKVGWTAEKIWGNFLHSGDGHTWFDVDENIESPTPEEQKKDVHKFDFRGGLKILKEDGNHFEIFVFKEKFQEIRQQFSNPKMAFDLYRLKSINPIALPEGTKWEHVIIKFLNGNDAKITLRNKPDFNRIISFGEMGFRNKKSQKPNEQWYLLMLFAKRGGAIFWEKKSNLKIQEINNLKTHKKLLSQTLKNLFRLEGDPFFRYNTEDGYKIKINLIPEKPERLRPEKRDEDSEISDYFQEQTPLVG